MKGDIKVNYESFYSKRYRMLDYLEKRQDTASTLADLSCAVRLSRNDAMQMLHGLIEDGLILRCGRSRYLLTPRGTCLLDFLRKGPEDMPGVLKEY